MSSSNCQIPFGHAVGIQTVTYNTYVNATSASNESPTHLACWLSDWEKWTLEKYQGEPTHDVVHFDDIVALKNNQFSTYLSSFSQAGYVKVTTQPFAAPQPAERWQIVPADPNQTGPVRISDVFYLKDVSGNNFVKVPGSCDQTSIPLTADQDSNSMFRFVRL